MPRYRNILLDDGGVMNDNSLRAPEWQRLVGEFLSPRLGGSPDAWAEANGIIFSQMWREFEDLLRPVQQADRAGFFDFFGDQRARWLRDMCAHVGVDAPDEGACREIGVETERYVLPRVRSAYPGAVDAIRALHGAGYLLGTASGQTSAELEGYLVGLGVRELFPERLYGPDLVDAMKGTTSYYERILADADLEPGDVIVLDDQPHALARAAAVGMTTVLVGSAPASPPPHHTIERLADLPALLAG